MYLAATVRECPHCDYVGEARATICPICSSEFDDRAGSPGATEGTDFQTGFRFALRLMEVIGHRIDTKVLFDTLTDLAFGDFQVGRPGRPAVEVDRSNALRMLAVIEMELRSREGGTRTTTPAARLEKVAA